MSYGDYPDLKSVKKILVVKMRHHGDVLLTSPVFTNLKKAIPDASIDALIYQDTLPMLEGLEAISDYLLYDRGWKKLSFLQKLKKELSLLFAIRKKEYDLVINLTEGDRGAIAALISKAKYRVGFDPEKKGFIGKTSIYTHLVKNCKTPRHTVEKQLDVLRRIGIFPKPEERDLSMSIPKEAHLKIEQALKSHSIEPNSYILIHPVSRWRFKCPPVSFITQVIEALHELKIPVVISSGPDAVEKAMVDEILKPIPHIPVLNMAGRMTLKELGALVSASKSLLCVDSVPLHIASALKTPVVVIFGPSSDQNWGPWMHPKSRVIAQKISCRPCFMDGCGGSKMSDCLYTLSINGVVEALQNLEDKVPLNLALFCGKTKV